MIVRFVELEEYIDKWTRRSVTQNGDVVKQEVVNGAVAELL